jgi:hypothetical protein
MAFVTSTNYGLGYGSSKYGPYQGCQTSMFGSCESVGGIGNKNINYQSMASLRPLTQSQKNTMMTKQAAVRSTNLVRQIDISKTFREPQISKEFVGIL